VTVFADTSGLLVVVDRDNADHQRGGDVWRRLVAESAVLMTSNYVLVETSALLQRRLGMEALRDFETSVVPLLQVEWIDADRHRSGAQAALSAGRRNLSLVDCVSFQLMRDRGVRSVFCFDDHFREQGFDVIPASL
jgi:predicted nucleic acid-binding protein